MCAHPVGKGLTWNTDALRLDFCVAWGYNQFDKLEFGEGSTIWNVGAAIRRPRATNGRPYNVK